MSLTVYTTTGPFKVELYLTNSQDSPILENFIRHVAKGTYENLRILRYINEFILQTGSNRSLHSIPADEEHPLTGTANSDILGNHSFKRGTIFTINKKGPGSQFFILLDLKHIDVLKQGDYTAIGEIIDGFDAIESVEKDIEVVNHISCKPIGKWKNKVWIERIEIHNNPFVS